MMGTRKCRLRTDPAIAPRLDRPVTGFRPRLDARSRSENPPACSDRHPPRYFTGRRLLDSAGSLSHDRQPAAIGLANGVSELRRPIKKFSPEPHNLAAPACVVQERPSKTCMSSAALNLCGSEQRPRSHRMSRHRLPLAELVRQHHRHGCKTTNKRDPGEQGRHRTEARHEAAISCSLCRTAQRPSVTSAISHNAHKRDVEACDEHPTWKFCGRWIARDPRPVRKIGIGSPAARHFQYRLGTFDR